MKFSPCICSFAIVAICGVTSAFAQNQASLQARIAARRELALAKLDLQNYWQVEYPRQRRELNLAIELTQAEIDGNRDAARILASVYALFDRRAIPADRCQPACLPQIR